MHTLKTMGVIGTAAAILLSASTVFAEKKVADTRGPVVTSSRQEIRETARERMESLREQAQASSTLQRQKAAERVAEIKDTVRQQKAQNLAARFENLNKVWTNHFMQLIERFDAIVQKMQTRADDSAARGKDATAANTAIQAAKSAIVTAQAAITAQAAKVYTPSVPPTTADDQENLMKNLQNSFKSLHESLFNDLFALRDGRMKEVRTAMQNALKALSAISGVDEENATSTKAKNQ